jgi:hypothetical protein
MVSIHAARSNFISLVVVALFVGTLALLYNSGAIEQGVIPFAPAPAIAEQEYAARGAKSNEGLLEQTALHLSKMERGASIGGKSRKEITRHKM